MDGPWLGQAFNPADLRRENQGAWLIAPELDQEAGWNSLSLIGDRLNQGADDFYILNFFKLKDRIDAIIDAMKG
jgi:hypothetical protein